MIRLKNYLLLVVASFISISGGCTKYGGVTLNWAPPSEYSNGDSLPLEELTEYRVYVDLKLVASVEPSATEYYLELPYGEWDVVVSAVAGYAESPLSETVQVRIPATN